MSLSSFIPSQVTDAANAIKGVLNDTPSTVPKPTVIVGSIVSLGDPSGETPFYFSEFELPASLTFGAYQMNAVHNFIGGGRGIDLYGDQPHPMELTGELFDLNPNAPLITNAKGAQVPQWPAGEALAMQRLTRLYGICKKGQEVLFQFHKFKFWAVVVDTSFTALHWHDARYTLKLEVLRHNLSDTVAADPVQAAKLNPPAHEGLLHQFTDFTSNINKYLIQAPVLISTLNAVVATLKTKPQNLLFAGVSLIPGSTQVQSLIMSALASGSAINNLNTTLSPQYAMDMSNAQPFNTLDNSGYTNYLQPSTKAIHTSLITATNFHMNQYPLIKAPTAANTPPVMLDPSQVTITALYGRRAQNGAHQIYKTMAKIIQPTRSYFLQVNNPNLSKVALQAYNDASKWQVIAAASGLTNMINTGVYTLTIPYLDQLVGSVPTLSTSTSAGT